MRKLKRNLTIHNEYKCECGATAKFYKTISFKSKKDARKELKPLQKDIITYHNVFWCKKCGELYKWQVRENNNDKKVA